MRVLHVTEALGGGIQSLMIDLVNQQAVAGAEVAVMFLPRVESYSRDVLCSLVEPEVKLIELTNQRGALRRMRTLRRAIAAAESSDAYDVIHLHSTFAGLAGRLSRSSGPRRLYSPHGFPFLRLDIPASGRTILLTMERFLARRCDGVVLTCRSELSTSVSQLGTRRRHYLLRTGVKPVASADAERNEGFDRGEGGLEDRRPIVTMVGRITYQKGPWRFAAVASALNEHADFVWVGDGHPGRIARWLADAPVAVTGWVDSTELRSRLDATDVLLFTSLWEGMSLSLMQAQMQGVPAVVSRAVGNVDAVEHGTTGYHAATTEELTQLTRTLILNSNLRTEMSAAAKLWARTELSSEGMGVRSLGIYAEVLADADPYDGSDAARSS